mgnify:CR=1 FL=1
MFIPPPAAAGERKRVTTAEMLVGPRRVLLLDEISTGLDSATLYSIADLLCKVRGGAAHWIQICVPGSAFLDWHPVGLGAAGWGRTLLYVCARAALDPNPMGLGVGRGGVGLHSIPSCRAKCRCAGRCGEVRVVGVGWGGVASGVQGWGWRNASARV